MLCVFSISLSIDKKMDKNMNSFLRYDSDNINNFLTVDEFVANNDSENITLHCANIIRSH